MFPMSDCLFQVNLSYGYASLGSSWHFLRKSSPALLYPNEVTWMIQKSSRPEKKKKCQFTKNIQVSQKIAYWSQPLYFPERLLPEAVFFSTGISGVVCRGMDGPRACRTEWSESGERRVLHIDTYMWHLEKRLRRSYLQGRNRLGRIKRLRLTHMHTTMCTQRASGKLLYTGSPAQCSVMR